MKTVLFLCTHNSVRSQMAEALTNHLFKDRYVAFSAGSDPTRVHPLAVRVMREIGLDISHHQAKHLEEFTGQPIDLVVTVCDHAQKTCPFFPGAGEYMHHSFPDPAEAPVDEAWQLAFFRSLRESIHSWLRETFAVGEPR